eukprot:scaffold1328_cov375-Pavlova_lutheri.AAC.3
MARAFLPTSATLAASQAPRTSCTRTISAPPATQATSAACEATSRAAGSARPVILPRNPFLDTPTSIGAFCSGPLPSMCLRTWPRFLRRARLVLVSLAKPKPGSHNMRQGYSCALKAACTLRTRASPTACAVREDLASCGTDGCGSESSHRRGSSLLGRPPARWKMAPGHPGLQHASQQLDSGPWGPAHPRRHR